MLVLHLHQLAELQNCFMPWISKQVEKAESWAFQGGLRLQFENLLLQHNSASRLMNGFKIWQLHKVADRERPSEGNFAIKRSCEYTKGKLILLFIELLFII